MHEYKDPRLITRREANEGRSPLAQKGDRYSFEYEGECARHNKILTVVLAQGTEPDDLVFFEDGSHAKQKHLLRVNKLVDR